jgi:CubicO group peptidase (beta-lactamase class C family)
MSPRFRFRMDVRLRKAARAVVLLALFPLAAFPGGAPDVAKAQTGDVTWPSKQIIRPRDIAVNYPCGGGSLCNLDDFIERQHVCALVVMSMGEVVLARTASRSEDDPCKSSVERDRYGIASITKSIVSLLFGFVFEDAGYGPPVDLDSSAADLIRKAGVPRYDGAATLRQLLHMASGMEWSDDETDAVIKVQIDQNGDVIGKYKKLKEAVTERLAAARFFPPGQFHYSGFDSQLIGILTESRLTPDKGFVRGTLDEALEHFLWQRLPMAKNAEWNADFGGHPAAHCCAYTSAEDLAALGNWVLKQYKQGTGAQADWIRASMADTVDAGWTCKFGGTERSFRYGYQWWIPSDDKQDGFTGIGTEGQYLHIFPEQDVVIAQFGEQLAGDSDTCEAMLMHRLIADTVKRN